MMSSHKSIIAFILYIIFLIVISVISYGSISNRAWLHFIGDMGVLNTVLWLICNSEYAKNNIGETVSKKYSRIFRWLAIIVLCVYVILLLR
jgi:hypothetical protein